MKKLISLFGLGILAIGISIGGADAYQVISSKELGKNEARNQNVVVKCTTDTGKVSNQTCTLRRFAKCNGTGTAMKCNGWQPWKNLRNPSVEYADWRTGAAGCCQSHGLR